VSLLEYKECENDEDCCSSLACLETVPLLFERRKDVSVVDCEPPPEPTVSDPTPAQSPFLAPAPGTCKIGCIADELQRGFCTKTTGCEGCPVAATCEKLCRRCEGRPQFFGGLDCGNCLGEPPSPAPLAVPATHVPTLSPAFLSSLNMTTTNPPTSPSVDAPVKGPCWQICKTGSTPHRHFCTDDSACSGCSKTVVCPRLCSHCEGEPGNQYGGLDCDCGDSPSPVASSPSPISEPVSPTVGPTSELTVGPNGEPTVGPNGWIGCPDEPLSGGETCPERGLQCSWNATSTSTTECWCADDDAGNLIWMCLEVYESGEWIGCPAEPSFSTGETCDPVGAYCDWDTNNSFIDCSCNGFQGDVWECHTFYYRDPYNCSATPNENGTTCTDYGAYCSWDEGYNHTDCYCSETGVWDCSAYGLFGHILCPAEPFSTGEACDIDAGCYWENGTTLTNTDCFCSGDSIWVCVERHPSGNWIGCPVEPSFSLGDTCDTECASCRWETNHSKIDCYCNGDDWDCYIYDSAGYHEYYYSSPNCSATPNENGTTCTDYGTYCTWDGGYTPDCYCSESGIWECSEYGPYGHISCPSEAVAGNNETCDVDGALCYWDWDCGTEYTDCMCYKGNWDCYSSTDVWNCSDTAAAEDGEICASRGARCSWVLDNETSTSTSCRCSNTFEWLCSERGPFGYEPPTFDCPAEPFVNGSSCDADRERLAYCIWSEGSNRTECSCRETWWTNGETFWECNEYGEYGSIRCPSEPLSNGTSCTTDGDNCFWEDRDAYRYTDCVCYRGAWSCNVYNENYLGFT